MKQEILLIHSDKTQMLKIIIMHPICSLFEGVIYFKDCWVPVQFKEKRSLMRMRSSLEVISRQHLDSRVSKHTGLLVSLPQYCNSI